MLSMLFNDFAKFITWTLCFANIGQWKLSGFRVLCISFVKSLPWRAHGYNWKFRVATAQGKQGKQGIWFLFFPDRENTGNLVLTQRKIC